MAYPQAYAQYRNQSVLTAGPERLLIMLYDGLLQKMERSKLYIQSGRLQEAHEELVKCQDIVQELTTSLNMEYEISKNLAALYDWFNRNLIEANLQKSVKPIDDITPQVKDMRDAWVQAADQVRKSTPAAVQG